MTTPSTTFAGSNHEVHKRHNGFTFRCAAWGLDWTFRSTDQAEFFLGAHLLYPVAPCTGAGKNPPSEVRP